MIVRVGWWGALVAAGLLACGGDDDPAESVGPDAGEAGAGGAGGVGGVPGPDAGAGGEGGAGGEAGGEMVGRCVYTNPFSRGDECKLYVGAAWTVDAAQADCAAVFPGAAGVFEPVGACDFDAVLGECSVGAPDADGYRLVSAGADAAQCGAARTGCEVFARGAFAPAGVCAMGDVCPEPPEVTGNVFVQPYTDCRDPLPGEPAGAGPGGQVCTPVIVSGCTEPDRRYGDYAACADVLTQRPYGVVAAPAPAGDDDPRLQDAAWLAESDWVKAQAESCACGCCHTTSMTRGGASGWDTEAGPLWIDTVPDSGLAMLAGLAPSESFGAVDALANNGFDRHVTGMPTTDVERMQRFLLGEHARRGLTAEDAARVPPFGGPLHLQRLYEPTACVEGVGVGPDGTLIWTGGAARYVYVLEADAENPGVPPNLDVPEKTRWLIDVPSDARGLACGMAYGEVPEGARQRVPADDVAPALTPGETYYLYVLRDVGLPITRCLFTYEGP